MIEIDFQKYLLSKKNLDKRSINKDVFKSFLRKLLALGKNNTKIIDVGCGTCSLVEFILQSDIIEKINFCCMDTDLINLKLGKKNIYNFAKKNSFNIYKSKDFFKIRKGDIDCDIFFLNSDIFSQELIDNFYNRDVDCIIANAFIDIVPIEDAITVFKKLLTINGFVYLTINYDGITTLRPSFNDFNFEKLLLKEYNKTMDERKLNGKLTGGSNTGSKIYDAFLQNGFKIINFGSSNWNVFPENKKYKKNEKFFLKTMIGFIYNEGLNRKNIDKNKLDVWYNDRLEKINNGELSLIVQNTDILAQIKRN